MVLPNPTVGRAALWIACLSWGWSANIPAQAEPDEITIVRSGAPQAWATLVRLMANQPSRFQSIAPLLSGVLKSDSTNVRRRAAHALSVLGPVAASAVPGLIAALADADTGVRAEAAFALDRVGERSERVLRALYRASMREAPSVASQLSPLPLFRMTSTIENFDALEPIAISEAFASELRIDLDTATGPRRIAALRVLSRTTARRLSDYLALLGDPSPGVRVFVARSLGSSGDTSTAVRAALSTLARDSVERVRIAGRGWLDNLNKPGRPSVVACIHRPDEGAIRATVEIPAASVALRGDGRGPYFSRRDSVDAYHGVAFNFELLPPRRGAQLWGMGPRRTTHGPSPRTFEVDLTAPIAGSGAVSLGTIRDPEASLHAFYLFDASKVIWNSRDIPIGARIASDRTEITFAIGGRWHRLQFGPWALGDCGEEYSQGGRIHGEGTSPVWVERLSVSDYRIIADSAARGRLWEYSNPSQPVDRGLYRFPFVVLVKAP